MGKSINIPFFPAKTKLTHKGFDDPPKLTEGVNDEKEAMSHYRRVRDKIKDFVENLPGAFADDIK